MHAYIILLMLCEAVANYEPQSDSPNVGTVLFTHADADCKRWKRPNIDLLQARKIFQELIPSPRLIETINEEYIANLLKYFQNSYTTVKREIKNPMTYNIMNIALSDAIGGYLKIWVLPITKYAFYAGTVSLDKATSIFQVYEDIKSKLNTDGNGWRSPNEDLLNSVAINIGSPPRSSIIRSMKDSCKQLSFFEKTETGLTVPLPVINWGMFPMMLFVPLKNETLVPLTSPSSSKTLLKYYDVAKNCMQSQSPKSLDNFNQRFQSWIVTDIAPHLNDDKLYVAFESILTLMNKTKNFCGKVSDAFDGEYSKIRFKALALGLPLHWTSKKYLIVFIILLIEIIWCVPTLVCLVRSKRKRRPKTLKYIRQFFKRKPTKHSTKYCEIHEDIQNNTDKREKGSRGVKLFLKPRTRNLEVDVQFPPYDCIMTKSSNSQSRYKTTSSEQITVINENSLKKILPEFDSELVGNQIKELSKIKMSEAEVTNEITGRSLISDEILEATETVTLIKDSEQTVKQFLYSEEKMTPKPSIIKSRTICKCSLPSGRTQENHEDCSCAPFTNYGKKDQKQETKRVTYIEPPTRLGRFRRKEKTQCKTIMRTLVDTKSQLHEETIMETSSMNVKSSKTSKVSSDHPLLRIKIERPKAEIKVGISNYRKCSESKKPSKIPRLAINETKTDASNVDAIAGPSAVDSKNAVIPSAKSIKKNSQDDSSVQRPPKDKKINITL